MFELDLNIIKIRILSKFCEDLVIKGGFNSGDNKIVDDGRRTTDDARRTMYIQGTTKLILNIDQVS